ncbi:MAG: NfeD family protein [Bacteroidales bacterium]|nr:NfeD family protein [Bacteroidales bacterium]
MNELFETYKTLNPMLQIYWGMAIVASVVFIFQAISVFAGFDADADVSGTDADFDADGFHLVSIKTIVCFILGFGWTGVLLWDDIVNGWLLSLIATLVGLLFMSLIAYMLYMVMKLDKDNTFHIQQTVGMEADVYLAIPGERAESGKVLVSVNGSLHELEALTDNADKIPTGSKVRVTSVEGNSLVIVEKI